MELINSFLLTASFLLVLNIAGYLSTNIKFYGWLEWLQSTFYNIGLQTHFMNFSKGVIDSRILPIIWRHCTILLSEHLDNRRKTMELSDD